nr:MAG TPA: hypothetical protein [Caudoviricetes sp.]DAW63333.1 MAG TPA: hypothetical protein [Caudoviricetes sp.]
MNFYHQLHLFILNNKHTYSMVAGYHINAN